MDIEYKLCKRFQKYKNYFRLLLVQTDSYQNKKYINLKEKFNESMYNFHKYNLKLITYKKKDIQFKIGLIGYDGKLKKIYKNFSKKQILDNIKSMPMGEKESKIKNKGLSLYEDYNPKTTLKGLGFKDEKTALYTIKAIKDKPVKYQKSVIITMYNRAKYHPNQTENMRKAMNIFHKWIKNKK